MGCYYEVKLVRLLMQQRSSLFIWEHRPQQRRRLGASCQWRRLHLLQPPTPPGWKNRKLGDSTDFSLVQRVCLYGRCNFLAKECFSALSLHILEAAVCGAVELHCSMLLTGVPIILSRNDHTVESTRPLTQFRLNLNILTYSYQFQVFLIN